jgi:hypothetical protein
MEVRALAVSKGGQPVDKKLAVMTVPAANGLAVTITDWTVVDLQAQAVPF